MLTDNTIKARFPILYQFTKTALASEKAMIRKPGESTQWPIPRPNVLDAILSSVNREEQESLLELFGMMCDGDNGYGSYHAALDCFYDDPIMLALKQELGAD